MRTSNESLKTWHKTGIVFLALLSIFALSCSKQSPDCGDPGTTFCQVFLADQNNHRLIGTTYPFDSLQLHITGKDIPLEFDNQGSILFSFSNLAPYNESNYLLYLNKDDTDTLRLYISTVTNACWSTQSLDSLFYNRQRVIPVAGYRFVVIK
ncbi:MAG: hypothetical protein KKD74_06490 [Bacteroidetes bacterium]|nr:hypothetical protein [Bacteroidota bacterium]